MNSTITSEAADGGMGVRAGQVTQTAEPSLCFAAGTLVLTEDRLRPIEEIEVGDLVWARSESTAELKLQPVVTLFRTPNKEILHLRLVDETGVSEEIGALPRSILSG